MHVKEHYRAHVPVTEEASAMSKAESSFNLIEGLKSLFKQISKKEYRPESKSVDPALLSFARLGLLAYYANPL